MLSGASGAPNPLRARAFVDLHCHTRGSFDSLSDPAAVDARRPESRADPPGDHRPRPDRRGAPGPRQRAARPDDHRRLRGEDGRRRPHLPVPRAARSRPGCRRPRPSPRRAIRAAWSGSPIRSTASAAPCSTTDDSKRLVDEVDWVEGWNARVVGRGGNERAAEFALEPPPAGGRGVRRPHDPSRSGSPTRSSTATRRRRHGLLAALSTAAIVPGRASYVARTITPLAKLVQRARGNGRVRPGPSDVAGAGMDR